jgi:hypothetical protein
LALDDAVWLWLEDVVIANGRERVVVQRVHEIAILDSISLP